MSQQRLRRPDSRVGILEADAPQCPMNRLRIAPRQDLLPALWIVQKPPHTDDAVVDCLDGG